MTTTYTADNLLTMTTKDIGELCKTNKVKKYTSLKLEEILEKLNISNDETTAVKKPRTNKCPKTLAKNHQGEEMIGVDGNMWSSILNAKGTWSWKKNANTADIEVMADFSKESANNTEDDTSDNEGKEDSKEEKKEEKKPKKEKSERKAPAEKAKEHAGEEMEGLDGNMYISVENKNGVYRWAPVKN